MAEAKLEAVKKLAESWQHTDKYFMAGNELKKLL